MPMSYKAVKAALSTIASQYVGGKLNFGYGTLAELNASGKQYPLVWWVLPVTVTEQRNDPNTAVLENWPIVLRFVDSVEFNKEVDDLDGIYHKMKTIADGFMYTLAQYNDELIVSQNIQKRQLYRLMDDIHTGWEYNFGLTVWPDVDNCCTPYES